MSAVIYKKNRLFMEGVPLESIAEKFGTPIYCYSATRLEENFRAYADALKEAKNKQGFTICYAVKANSNQAVLKLLGNLGAGADIVSGGELARARKSGIPAKKIVYSGVGKSEKELTAAIKAGLLQINVESEAELELISKIAARLKKTVKIALRVNPDVDAKTHKKITTGKKEDKFGIDIGRAPALYDRAKRLPGIVPCGVAVHIGSQLISLNPFRKAYVRVADLVQLLRQRGHVITTVDLGGGIGIPYKDETPPDLSLYAKIVRETIVPLGVHIVVEPGRYIVGDAGILLSRVMNVKHSPNSALTILLSRVMSAEQSEHKTFVILDAAMNDLMRPALYDAWHDILPCKKTSAKTIICDVVGPVCETGDTFHTGIKMLQLKTGDLAAIMTAGAYGSAMSSTYNTRPLAPEVMVKGKKFDLVRKIQTADDLIAADIIPKWLT